MSRLQRLAYAISEFADPTTQEHQTFCRHSLHMTSAVMSEGLQVSLGPWNAAGLIALKDAEEAYTRGGIRPHSVMVVLGGVLPPSHIQAISYPYLLGARVYVKPPSADRTFAERFVRILDDDVSVVDGLDDEHVSASDALVVVGSDESVRAVESRFPVGTPTLGFGHKTSAAIVTPDADVAALARDATLFDQQGCMSPREILVIGTPDDAVRLAEGLAVHFSQRVVRFRLSVAVEAALRTQREEALMRGRTVLGPDDLGWTIIVEEGGKWRGTPGGCSVVVRAMPDPNSAVLALTFPAAQITAVAVSGVTLSKDLRLLLARSGVSRLVHPGELQMVPPTWPHDGRRPLASLCRWMDG